MGKKDTRKKQEGRSMGEIKSTLDLVLERTRDLTLSDAEKQKLKQEGFRKHIRGLIIRFQKGEEPMASIGAELEKAGVEFGLEPQAEFFCEILSEISLEGNNDLLLSLVRKICNRDTREIEGVLSGYADEVSSARNHRNGMIRKELSKLHGISGDAVVPNLEADENWGRTLQQIRNRHLRRLEGLSKKAGCR
jgi:hypothetical protein